MGNSDEVRERDRSEPERHANRRLVANWSSLLFVVGLLAVNVFLYGADSCDPQCTTDADCPDDGNDCTQPSTCNAACLCKPGISEPAGTLCDLASTGDGLCDGSGSCTPVAPTVDQLASCFAGASISGMVPPLTEARLYRDSVVIDATTSDASGLASLAENGCDLALDTLYSYQLSYVDGAGVESALSEATETTLLSSALNCPSPGPCDGPDCKVGLTEPTIDFFPSVAVADEASSLSVRVTSTHPGVDVQIESPVNRTQRIWIPIGGTITTSSTPTCVNGQPIYETSTDLMFPSDIWESGTSGSSTSLRATVQTGLGGTATVYKDWDACAAANPELTSDALFDTCPNFGSSGITGIGVRTSDYTPPSGSAPTVAITNLECTSATVVANGTNPATIFLDGLPVHGYGSSARNLSYLVPGELYTVEVAKTTNGANGPLSVPVEVTPPDCPSLGSVFDLGISLVVFQGVTAELPYTPEEFEQWVFGDPDDDNDNNDSFRDYIEEISRGQTTVTGDVDGWLVFPGNVADYCPDVLEDGTGVPPCPGANPAVREWLGGSAHTNHTVIVFGAGPGQGINFGNVSHIPGRRDHPLAMLAHEAFGHALTDGKHSGAMVCPSGSSVAGPVFARASGCTGWTNGDVYDPLGPASEFHFNTYNLHRLGLLSISETERATAIEGDSSEHWIGTLNSLDYPKKLLRVPLDKGGVLLLEFRDHTGFDGTFPCLTCDPPRPGVSSPASRIPAPEGLQIRLHLPVELSDWKTAFPLGPVDQPPYLYGPNLGEGVVLSLTNPVFDEFGVRIEVLEQDADGIRVRVEQ
jgi:hypothetical protein